MTDAPQPLITSFTLGPVETNCFLVTAPDGPDPQGCWILDCGMEPAPMLDAITAKGLQPRGILLTHAHYDHIGGIAEARDRFGTMPILIHEIEREWNQDPMYNLSGSSPWPCVAPASTATFVDDEMIDLCATPWKVLHLPGHSPGSCGFLHAPSATLIAGDTLFRGSIGRVDFPTSNPQAMRDSLTRLMALPDTTRVIPGHGPETTIGLERSGNPFILDWGLAD